ncbi:hypothetical protein R3W88_008196 [Solanum pinnatisectum]|uniref:Bifunctional inhibitor/plant lipid transfer protein/seed storage helical domain-containing protein n=1 Tax=Solanum pinnatisectum TaxID=50273 RepID=A0AAV9MA90_9SOLN|nr:hypothetical protein R3W88_008196 [Solanum pinnatisectum]
MVSMCANFVNYGTPDPIPGAPCCIAMTALGNTDCCTSIETQQSICRCLMNFITTYSLNAIAIAHSAWFLWCISWFHN